MPDTSVGAPERSALMAVCCNQPTVFTKCTQSLMELGWGDRIPYAKQQAGFDRVELQWFGQSPRVDMLRNMACRVVLDRGYSHLIFLDADMVWPTTVLHQLLQHHDDGIVAGLYVLKSPPYGPVHLQDPVEKDGVQWFTRVKDFGTDLVPVDVVGMGCTILPVSLIREMGERDWFRYEVDVNGYPRVSEDVPFCLRAKEMGAPIWMDPAIKCGHITTQVIDHRWHYRYQASVEASHDQGPMVTFKESEPVEA